jgi:hypothetical protein
MTSRWCMEGEHLYCGGLERDRGDGTLVPCECRCHGPRVIDEDYDAVEREESET